MAKTLPAHIDSSGSSSKHAVAFESYLLTGSAVPAPAASASTRVVVLPEASAAPAAAAAPAALQRDEQPRSGEVGSSRPIPLVQGQSVEFFSQSHGCWMKTQVTSVDEETGDATFDVKPNSAMDLQEQAFRIRPRTRPTAERLQWVRELLRDGGERLEQEARMVFDRHGFQETAYSEKQLLAQDAHAAGDELDSKLGTCGAACAILQHMQDEGEETIDFDGLLFVFWELLWSVHEEFCEALSMDCAVVQPASSESDPRQKFLFGKTLGSGTYGMVRFAREKGSGAARAIKVIKKEDHVINDQVEPEVERLRALDHPHIVRLYEHWQDVDNFYLVMDFCSGGDLFGAVIASSDERSPLPEYWISCVVRQILLAIAHVHAKGIIHLDLKSANVMLMPSRKTLPPGRDPKGFTLPRPEERPHVMVIDLGVAQIFRPGQFYDRNAPPTGTPVNMAPEAWKGEFTPKADIWSIGVILFELLTLAYPFDVPCDRVKALDFWEKRPETPWVGLRRRSEDANSLCRSILKFERHERPTASQCLQAPFLEKSNAAGPHEFEDDSAALPPQLVQQLANAPKRSVLYNSIALSIARAWPANQLPTVRRLFEELDTSGTGLLPKAHIKAFLEGCGVQTRRAAEAAEALDLDRDGAVNWTEFVAACIDLGSVIFEEDLAQVFASADQDSDGLLSQQDIAGLLAGEHLGHSGAAKDVFVDLVARMDEGARVDWPTFRQHFRKASASAAASFRQETTAPSTTTAWTGPTDFLAQARDLLERARQALWREPAQEADPEKLKQLKEMGFNDTERCVAVLKKYGNELGPNVFEELCKGGQARRGFSTTPSST